MTRPSDHRELIPGWVVLAAALAACGSSKPAATADGSPPGANPSDAGTGDDVTGIRETGADTTAEAGVNACSALATRIPGLDVRTIGPGGAAYEGPAIVERSSGTELVLAFTPGGAGGTTSALPQHARIRGLTAMPVFPLGARVWLFKNPAGDPSVCCFGPQPWSIAVRDKQGGRLLFGAGKEPAAAAFAPLSFDNRRMTCAGAYSDGCGTGTVTHSSVEVHADTTVVIGDGETRPVRAGGVEYDVTVMANDIEATTRRCADYYPYDGFAVDIRARDLGPLVAGLEVGAPIACARGSADLREVGFSFFEVASRTPYDGKAFYMKRDLKASRECFQFSVELTSDTGTAVAEFCTSPGLFREPTQGQELWVTTSSWRLAALRGANRGPLLLAAVYADAPFDAATSAQLESTLGVHLEARPTCRYADGKPNMPATQLWEVVLGAPPPVVLGTDGHAVVRIGGKDHDAWMWADGLLTGALPRCPLARSREEPPIQDRCARPEWCHEHARAKLAGRPRRLHLRRWL